MKKQLTQFAGGGNHYLAPEMEVVEVSVEQGFTLSDYYGEEGDAGGDLGEDNYGDY